MMYFIIIFSIIISFNILNAEDILYDSTDFKSKCEIIENFKDPFSENRAVIIDYLYFFDENNGFVFTNENYYNRLYETTNKGTTWHQKSITMDSSYWLPKLIAPPLFKEFAIYDNTILILSHPYKTHIGVPQPTDSGLFWRSSDLGNSWDTIRTNFKYKNPTDLSVNNSGDFYFNYSGALDENDSSVIFRSNDFGEHWESFYKTIYSENANPFRIVKIFSVDNDYFSFLEQNNDNELRIKYSYDYGLSWEHFKISPEEDYNNVNVVILNDAFGIVTAEYSSYKGEGLYDFKIIYYKLNIKKNELIEFSTYEKTDIEYNKLYHKKTTIYNEEIFLIRNSLGDFITFDSGNIFYSIKDKLIDTPNTIQFISGSEFISYYKNSVQKFSYEFPSTSVEDVDLSDNCFSIHPNPASDYIEISINKPSCPDFIGAEGSEIAIYDVLGLRIITVETRHALSLQRIDISHLPRGVYFVRIGGNIEKFIKN